MSKGLSPLSKGRVAINLQKVNKPFLKATIKKETTFLVFA